MINYDQYAPVFINKLDLKRKTAIEHAGKCPICGGKDRFRIQNYKGELTHHCRKLCSTYQERLKLFRDLGLIPESLSTSVPYHQKKNIPLLGGAKLDDDVVKVPITELKTGNHRGQQMIYPNGKKLFSKGMSKEGAGCFIGEKSNILYVCEGWATAVAIHKATGEQALFALDAKTMVKTVKELDHPNIIIAADHDEAGIEAAKATGLPYALPEKKGWDWWDAYNTSGIEAVKKQLTSLNGKDEQSSKPDGKLFTKLSEIDRTAPVPIIEDMIFARTFVSITGASFSGKSFIALDAFLSIAAGIDYHGRSTEQGNVGLVIGEGQSGIYQRCEAWCSAKNVNINELPFYISNQPIDIRDKEWVAKIINEFKPMGQFQAVIIDTLARNFGGGNENAPNDMGAFIMNCDEIINALGCSVVVVHHTGKDHTAGARGHSSFFGALETEILVKAVGDHEISVTCTKQKDAKQFEPMQFGKIETENSIILEPVVVTKRQGKSNLTRGEELGYNTFVKALRDKQATNGFEMPCRLHLEEWRDLFRQRHTGDNKKSKDKAFQRARESLVEKKILQVKDDYYSYGDKATNGDKW